MAPKKAPAVARRGMRAFRRFAAVAAASTELQVELATQRGGERHDA